MSGDAPALSSLVSTMRGPAAGPEAMFELAIDGAVARLTMARASTRNALRVEDWRALVALIEQAGRMKARALIIASRVEGAFCAGADLSELHALHDDPAARLPFRNAMRAALDAIRNSRLPVIAMIDGGCYGAGVALAIACDMRVAGPKAKFAVPPAKLGISYPLEDIARLRALVGDGHAARLLLAATVVDGPEAVRIGLAEMPGGIDVAHDIAKSIAANAPSSVALLKQGAGAGGGRQEQR